jgi:hypothetical protein
MRTREDHLAFCKKRAHEYLDRGDTHNAVTSMLSDLSKHPETEESSKGMLASLGMLLLIQRVGIPEIQRFIDGFN